jgi:hypothetical protein
MPEGDPGRTEPGGAPSSLRPKCCTGSGEACHGNQQYHDRPPISPASLRMEKEVVNRRSRREGPVKHNGTECYSLFCLMPYSVLCRKGGPTRLRLRDFHWRCAFGVIIRHTVDPRAHGVAAHVRRVERQLLRERTIYQLSTLLAKATGWVFLSSA